MSGSPVLLLVEDEALIAELIQIDLEDAGFVVVLAASGAQAIHCLESGAAPFSGIITDIKIGSDGDGWAIARHARELIPGIPVVYMSGHGAAEWIAKGVPQSVMVAKPFTPAEVVTAIALLLNQTDALT